MPWSRTDLLWVLVQYIVGADIAENDGVTLVMKRKAVVNIYSTFPHARHAAHTFDMQRWVVWVFVKQ